ncbi:hypothetical protein ACA910_014853 [Epithemia clementina (nom. ined.)]
MVDASNCKQLQPTRMSSHAAVPSEMLFISTTNTVDTSSSRPSSNQDLDQPHLTATAVANPTPGAGNQNLMTIGPYDVLCGRDKTAFNNIGNRRLRVFVSLYLTQYLDARGRLAKSKIIETVADSVRSSGGRFLKWCHETHTYMELCHKEAYCKCGHAFRDMATARMASSGKNKNQENGNRAMSRRVLVPIHLDMWNGREEPIQSDYYTTGLGPMESTNEAKLVLQEWAWESILESKVCWPYDEEEEDRLPASCLPNHTTHFFLEDGKEATNTAAGA